MSERFKTAVEKSLLKTFGQRLGIDDVVVMTRSFRPSHVRVVRYSRTPESRSFYSVEDATKALAKEYLVSLDKRFEMLSIETMLEYKKADGSYYGSDRRRWVAKISHSVVVRKEASIEKLLRFFEGDTDGAHYAIDVALAKVKIIEEEREQARVADAMRRAQIALDTPIVTRTNDVLKFRSWFPEGTMFFSPDIVEKVSVEFREQSGQLHRYEYDKNAKQ